MKRFDLSEINSMDGFEFEALIAKLIEAMGHDVEQTEKTGDGGIDIIAHTDKAIIAGKYVIQCKRQESPIGAPTVRDLYGTMTSENANKGILITSSSFTADATAFAEGKPIELIDGTTLMNLLTEYLTDQDIVVDRISPVHQVRILNKVADSIERYEKRYNDLNRNLVYSPGKSLNTFSDFASYTLKDLDELLQLAKVLVNVVDHLGSVLVESIESADNEKVKSALSRLDDILSILFKRFKNAHSIRVQQDLMAIKEKYLELYTVLFDALIHLKNSMLDALTHPEEYAQGNKITLAFDLNFEKMSMVLQEYGKELQRLG